MKISETMKTILARRGITDEAEIAEFLAESPKRTYDPFLLRNMEEGVSLILHAAESGKRICIYGDYDADGITSTTLMLSILGHLTAPGQVDYYIPSRFEEGYGLNKEALAQIHAQGFEVVITVDCGSVSADEVAYGQALGLTILVTDHHNVTDTIADCLVINPKQPGCPYPFKSLAGCGVAFKVAQALQQRAGLPKSVLTEVLDLVAIGTIGDIMPLLDENRTMTKFGLKIVNLGRRAGLRALLQAASLKPGEISSEQVSFVIVPHLNASGRIEDASVAVELLRRATAPETAEERLAITTRAEQLVHQNQMRKWLQQETFTACVKQLEAAGEGSEETVKDFILIRAEHAHEGIAGIVAGKIKETFYRPTVIVTPAGEDKAFLKGTGRSIAGVDLYQLLKGHEALFDRFGGHAGACGFLMPQENYEALREGLLADMGKLRREEPGIFQRQYAIDLAAQPEELTLNLAAELALLEPFGNQNPKPLFYCSQVMPGDVRFMGEQNQHVRFTAQSETGGRLHCVLFGQAQRYSQMLFARRPVDLIGALERSVWQGTERLQFFVEEITV